MCTLQIFLAFLTSVTVVVFLRAGQLSRRNLDFRLNIFQLIS